MFKLFMILAVAFGIGKLVLDRFADKARSAGPATVFDSPAAIDAKMAKLVDEMRTRLPTKVGNVRVDNVEYANRVMTMHGMLTENATVTDDDKREIRKSLTAKYCAEKNGVMKYGVSLDYSLRTIQSLHDKLVVTSWLIAPADCK